MSKQNDTGEIIENSETNAKKDVDVLDQPSEVIDATAPETILEKQQPVGKTEAQLEVVAGRIIPWFGLVNLILIVLIILLAGWYWQQAQIREVQYQQTISDLQSELSSKINRSDIATQLSPYNDGLKSNKAQLQKLQKGQKGLRQSSEKLYELFGRDKNSWQLAEVEYLLRIAQHKLILENDFAGSAITLQAASDKIATTGDPGLLPVRLKISDEIAGLKTRGRPDLVGMALKLTQLSKQLVVLKPGFTRQKTTESEVSNDQGLPDDADWLQQVKSFFSSLWQIRKDGNSPNYIEADIVRVDERVADNLKLARWAVLERDQFQYRKLIDRTVELFAQYYEPDNAANFEFRTELEKLQTIDIRPELPDITGSLEHLRRIIEQRNNAPSPNVESNGVSTNG
jgi:uroporphyrin-III C-methyltransferase